MLNSFSQKTNGSVQMGENVMAKCVIPPKTIIVKCRECRTLYVPEREKDVVSEYWKEFEGFEPCPICGQKRNGYSNTIPLWKYNLIKLFRGGFRK